MKFYYHIDKMIEKVERNIWKLRNITKSVSSYDLLLTFYTWVFPQFLYGAPLWIFQVFKVIECGIEPAYGYKVRYDKLNSLYLECGKLILGVPKGVNGYAVLTRLNWLPLNYILGLQSVSWLYRMQLIPDSEVTRFFVGLKSFAINDIQWGNTKYFKPAYNMIKRLEHCYNTVNTTDCVFLELNDIQSFKKVCKVAAYYEVNLYWQNYHKARYTHSLYGDISFDQKRIVNVSYNRKGEMLYHRLCFEQNFLNLWKFNSEQYVTDLCRFCALEIEDVTHIFCECERLDHDRLKIVCQVYSLLTDVNLKTEVEKFLCKYFLKKLI